MNSDTGPSLGGLARGLLSRNRRESAETVCIVPVIGLERQQQLSTATSTGMSMSDAVGDIACTWSIRLPGLE